jgi:TetR/AcrR family transcriptional regulator of autoinduction and epiphytic fitness
MSESTAGPVPPHAPTDRREAVKFHNRRAIIDAAAVLVEERGLGGFTVTDLAERAGVSRRTIFNHFASAEDAVYAGFSEALEVLVDNFVATVSASPQSGGSDLAAAFEQMATVMQSTDLVRPLARIVRVISAREDHPDTALWGHQVLQSVTARMTAEITDRYPQADAFSVAVLVGSLTNAAGVTLAAWAEQTGAADTPGGRLVWHRLLGTAVEHLRYGFTAGDERPPFTDYLS